MIAKEIKKKNHNQASFKKLANYITRNGSDLPIKAVITNCAGQEYDVAIKSIEALQDLARGNQDKTYHLVLSFHPKDDLSSDRLAYIENECCKVLGFAEHQRFSALHRDTNNPHLHIAINKVHPLTKRQITPYFSYQKLAKFCQKMELELGLIPDNHKPKQAISAAVRDMEIYSGKSSLKRYIVEQVKPNLSIKSSDELGLKLQEFGLTVKSYGKGLVIGDGNYFVKASYLGDTAKKFLQDFNLDKFLQSENNPKQTYQSAINDDLWQLYQQERNQALVNRKNAKEQLSAGINQQYLFLSDKYAKLRNEVKNDKFLNHQQKFALYKKLGEARRLKQQKIKQQIKNERQLVYLNNPLLTWQDFLIKKAINGNQSALKKLQSLANKNGANHLINQIKTNYGEIANSVLSVLENKAVNQPSKTSQSINQQELNNYINKRNQLINKVSDIKEHRHFGKQTGKFVYEGVREIAKNQFVALFYLNNITYVKPISENQQRFLKTIKRGSLVEVNEKGQFNHKKRVLS